MYNLYLFLNSRNRPIPRMSSSISTKCTQYMINKVFISPVYHFQQYFSYIVAAIGYIEKYFVI